MKQAFFDTRLRSEAICALLQTEDHVIQPIVDVSPPKWHLAHTTWFFEAFVLQPFFPKYALFDPNFFYLFNSYYQGMGERVPRNKRGSLSRPGVEEVLRYRNYVTEAMYQALNSGVFEEEALRRTEIGLQHEQQHQELLLTDIKYILGNQPFFPAYDTEIEEFVPMPAEQKWLTLPEGLVSIGHQESGFSFDNERQAHSVWIEETQMASRPVNQKEYLEFMQDGGYADHRLWLAEGWDWVQQAKWISPMYWHRQEGQWMRYGLKGLEPIDPTAPVAHLSFFEAEAYARWVGARLPLEAEWETAARLFPSYFPLQGWVWEWTGSAYRPYPGFATDQGALGEYNGKFMSGQMVLRGGSAATPEGHSRPSYRNFFHPHLRWQYAGLRLAK